MNAEWQDKLNNDFLDAARAGRHIAVSAALAGGADIHADGDAAFITAAASGDVKTLGLLLDEGADINAQAGNALLKAARNGHEKVLQFLWEKGADFSAGNYAVMSEAKGDMREPVLDLVSSDRRRAKGLFDKHFGGGFMIADLVLPVDANGTTGVMLAAKAGYFKKVVEQAATEGSQFPLEKIRAKDALGRNIYGMLNRDKELEILVRPELWTGRQEEFRQLWLGMPDETKLKADFDSVLSAIDRHVLRERLPHPPKLKRGHGNG